MKGAQENVPIGSASGEHIPHYHAHAPVSDRPVTLLTQHHAQNGTAREASLLDFADNGKEQLSTSIIRFHSPTGGFVASLGATNIRS
jgi:hypothetical protein